MYRKILNFGLLFILVGLLLARLHVAFIRYFDPDEFAHMHWAYLLTIGKLPYKDFFYYVLPLYQFFLSPIFFLRASADVVIAARVWQYFLYAANVILVYRIGAKATNSRHIGLLSSVIFAAFPMTFDKTIDIRPDMLMVFFYLLSVDIIIYAERWDIKRALAFGISIALSGLTLPKIVFAVPALVFLLFARKVKPTMNSILWMGVGAAIPVVFLLEYLTLNNLLSQATLSLLKDSVAVNAGKSPFSPWKALSPWPLVYVESAGPSFPWYVNTVIWYTAIAGLILMLVKKPLFGIFNAIFFIAAIFFLFLFPAPYVQYFLPLSVFSSILAAAILSFLSDSLRFITKNQTVTDFVYLCLITFVVSCLVASFDTQYRIRVRAGNSNEEQTGVINNLIKISKPEETVYDMVGSYVFRPDAYYFCCHPYGEFADNATVKPGPLRNFLVSNKTKYIILDRTGMSLWQTPAPDLLFIKSHYVPSQYLKIYTPGSQFTCENSACHQLDVEGNKLYTNPSNVFQIIIPDFYTISTTPPGKYIKINDVLTPLGSIELRNQFYEFKVDSEVTSLMVRLTR
jgi:hypothetical protein